MSTDGALTVVIPTWNGRERLATLLLSLRAQSSPPTRVLVVDDGSTDDTAAYMEQNFAEAEMIHTPHRSGFASAANAGMQAALDRDPASVIFLLNNDTQLDVRCCARIRTALDTHPEIFWFAPRMVRMNDRDVMDGAGDVWRRDGRPGRRGAGEWAGAHPVSDRVLSASGGAMVVRPAFIERVGMFDADFEAYLEDIDLGLRALLRNSPCLYIPDAIVYHAGAATYGEAFAKRRTYLITRNRLRMLAKNIPFPVAGRDAAYLVWGFVKSFGYHLRRPRFLPAFLRGFIAGVFRLPASLAARRRVHAAREISASDMARALHGEASQ